MKNSKRKSHFKKLAFLIFTCLLITVPLLATSATADTIEGASGETSSTAISSQKTSSEEETSSEESTSSEETPQSFGARAGENTYNMDSGPLTISKTSGNWIITGSYQGPSAGITVEFGYVGTITLNGVSIKAEGDNPAMILDTPASEPLNDVRNDAPATQVKLLLKGNNELYSGYKHTAAVHYAGLDVMTGTEVIIENGEALGNPAGTLLAQSGRDESNHAAVDIVLTSSAGIGAGFSFAPETRSYLGGNVIIKSGTIEAYGGYHGAGIGGGQTANDTNVIIIGGDITSIGGKHAFGIGGGCNYNINGGSDLTKNTGSLVVLPPAAINSTGGNGMVGNVNGGSVYIGDSNSPSTQIYTQSTNPLAQKLPNAKIYVDFSRGAGKGGDAQAIYEALVKAGLSATEIQEYYIGETQGSTDVDPGIFELRAQIATPLTFYTDANYGGTPFLPQEATPPSYVSGTSGPTSPIELPLSNMTFTPTTTPSADLTFNMGATPQSQTFQLAYSGNMEIKNATFTLFGDDADKFSLNVIDAQDVPLVGGLANYTYKLTVTPLSTLSPGTYKPEIKFTGKASMTVGSNTVETTLGLDYTLPKQTLQKNTGTADTDGTVTGNPAPVSAWRNTSSVVLTPSLEYTGNLANNAITNWSYIVDTSTTTPSATDSKWASQGTAANATYSFPAGTDDTFYIHWKIESTHATDMMGTVKSSSTTTYNVDLVAPTVTNISAGSSAVGIDPFDVTITFSEGVSSFAASSLVATNATISSVAPIASTETFPSSGLYTGYTVTMLAPSGLADDSTISLKVPANITTDRAENQNTSSTANEKDFSIPFSKTRPFVTYSFSDQQLFITEPVAGQIKVSLHSNGKVNQKLIYAATGIEIANEFPASYIYVNGSPVDGSSYSSSFDESQSDLGIYTYTITASNGFLDGPFTVEVKGHDIKNSEGYKLDDTAQTFYVEIPKVTGITASPNNMNYDGGNATITVTGEHLDNASTVEIYNPVDGKVYPAIVQSGGTTATYVVNIPKNQDYSNAQNYTFYPLLNGGAISVQDTLSVYRHPSSLIFDVNGGETGSAPPTFTADVGTAVDISAYTPGKTAEPTYEGFVFMGWVYADGSGVPDTFTLPAGETTISALWLDLSQSMSSRAMPYIVTRKGESTRASIEQIIDGKAEYTDSLGVKRELPVDYTWNDSVLTEGGVIIVRPYIPDPKTGQPVYLTQTTYLYVLNPPYITGTDYLVVFEGDSVTGNEFSVAAVGEEVDLTSHTIRKVFIPVNFHGDSIDTQTAGLYPAHFTATFTDYFGKVYELRHNVQVKVMKPAGLSKEEQLQVDSSHFWVKVASVYHKAKDGEIWEVTPENYMDGGKLISKNNDFKEKNYNFQVNVTVGKFIYMNPVVLDQVRTSSQGRLVVNLENRQLSFTKNDFVTNPNNLEPKGYFNLRMIEQINDKIIQKVGTEQPQMQLSFDMNRAWLAEPFFSVKINDSLKTAVSQGSTLYLFNYNENTDELELVGNMIDIGNGYFGVQMTGIYKDYVILADLPSVGSYRITDQTTSIDTNTYQKVVKDLEDSGWSIPEYPLNAISTNKTLITEAYKLPSVEIIEPENNFALIIIGGISILGIGSGVYLFYRKKNKE